MNALAARRIEAAPPPQTEGQDLADLALTLMTTRHNVSPKRLAAPAPTEAQLHTLLTAAAAAPDHGEITPWRFILVPVQERQRLAEAFAQALLDRDPQATAEQVETAREKAHRAPMLLLAIARLGPCEPDIQRLERVVSMGAAIQNLMLSAHALGFGVGLTSGQAMSSHHLAVLCDLSSGEVPVCCINIGTATQRKASRRLRPLPAQILSVLSPAS